ncbi:MAG: hypothetical protein ACLP8S_10155 [Solirubrobacteraceae bacterium]
MNMIDDQRGSVGEPQPRRRRLELLGAQQEHVVGLVQQATPVQCGPDAARRVAPHDDRDADASRGDLAGDAPPPASRGDPSASARPVGSAPDAD